MNHARRVGVGVLVCVASGSLGTAAAGAEHPPGNSGTTQLPVIKSSGEFWEVPAQEKDLPHRFELELTANYYDPYWKLLWAADGAGQSYLPLESTTFRLKSGQRVRLEGVLTPSRGLPLATAALTIIGDGSPVLPLNANGDLTNAPRFDAKVVSIAGYVNSQVETDSNHLTLDLAVDGVRVAAPILVDQNSPIPQVEGAIVRLRGVYSSANATSPLSVWVSRGADVEVLGWLEKDLRFLQKTTAIDELPTAPPNQIAHVVGTVQSQVPGTSILLRDATGEVVVKTAMSRIVTAGMSVEAIGYPASEGLNTVLRQSLFRVTRDRVAPPKDPAEGARLPLLRLARQVRRLKPSEAERGYFVRLRGVVSWSHPGARYFFLLDSSGGTRVQLPNDEASPPPLGNVVDVSGHTTGTEFAPGVVATSITLGGWMGAPETRAVTLEQAMTGVEESQWISLTGYVRTVRDDAEMCRLNLTTSAGEFSAIVPRNARTLSLEGAVIEMRGVCRATTDDKRRLTGIELWVANSDDIRIEEAKPVDPFDLETRSIASLRQFNTLDGLNRRVHVAGVVLDDEPGVFFHVEESGQSLMVLSRETERLAPGDYVDVVGFPGRQGARLVLREAVYRKLGTRPQPPVAKIDGSAAPDTTLDGRLVEIETILSDVTQHPDGIRLVSQSQRTLFEATLPKRAGPPPKDWAVGSRVRLTGVYVVQFDQNLQPHGFVLQLRNPGDVAVISPPPWWNAVRARNAAMGLALGGLLILVWVLALRRRVDHQTEQIRQELERSARLEAELARSSKLESLGVLAGGIAHDFNNLLTVIIGNLSLVLGDRRLGPEDEASLRDSERAALRARDLTQQLLTFAKGGSPVRTAVLLPDIVREAAGFARHGSSVRCDFQFADPLWPAHVDRGQISQVVHNIVLNAMQAMPTGGVVEITLENEYVTPEAALPLQPGRYVKIGIRDTGPGISPAHLTRIFEPYFTTKQQGSGLGLATVYSIVKKHAGHIDVRSELGKGTTFTVWLPAAENADTPAEANATAAVRMTGRVLFMDDERAVRNMATTMLRRLGFEVEAVNDGQAAVDAYRSAREDGRPFTLVMLDLTVPGAMGGREAMAELLRLDPYVCAIVSSGYSNDPVMAEYRTHGFNGRVPKPYEFEEFSRVVTEVMATRDD